MNKFIPLFSIFVLSLFVLISKPANSQYFENTVEWTTNMSLPQLMTVTKELCTVDTILEHPLSVEALDVYHELRRMQPEGALVESLNSNAQVGDTRTFRVRNIQNQSQWITTNFTLRARDERLLIWVENGEFAANKVNQSVVDGLMTAMRIETPIHSYDTNRGILDINTEVFGNLPNVDGSNTLNILITDINDGWTPERPSFTAGFFDPVDLNPNNANSNGADIIYLNSMPLVYQEGSSLINETRIRSVAAHELQHLIHANYRNLVIFQNEGQSEYSELLTGFPGRNPIYLSNPIEFNRPLYLWRGGQPQGIVLRDYERAANFHAYIAERVGPLATGRITRSQSPFNNAYNFALTGTGLTFEDILLDFHIANYINDSSISDGRFGYEDIRRRSFRVSEATYSYLSGQTSGSGNRSLEFGGVNYIEWNGAEDLELIISGEDGVEFGYILYPLNDRTNVQIGSLSHGSHLFDGKFEKAVLVAVATTPGIGSANEPAPSIFSYESSWSTLPIIFQDLNYAAQPAAFQEIPGDQTDPQRSGIRTIAQRYSPEFDGFVRNINFPINGRPSGITGSGELVITLNQTAGTVSNPRPGIELYALSIPVNRLSRGENSIDISSFNWEVSGGEDFFLTFSTSDNQTAIEFLLDSGSTNQNNSNYFPTRTTIFVEPPSSTQAGWFTFSNRNNLVASISVFAEYDGPIQAPVITQQPLNTQAIFDSEATLSIGFTGTPTPMVQWFKDDEPVYGQRNAVLTISNFSQEDSGVYTALVSNPGGSVLSDAVLLSPDVENFEILQNYPNPVVTQTNLRFILPEDSNVTIDLYNTNGQKVAKILRNAFYPEGLNEVNYSPRNLASGLYFYRIRAEAINVNKSFTNNGRMIIIRR